MTNREAIDILQYIDENRDFDKEGCSDWDYHLALENAIMALEIAEIRKQELLRLTEDKQDNQAMTPHIFALKMELIACEDIDDTENNHIEADKLLVKALNSLGYTEGCEIYELIGKWYS